MAQIDIQGLFKDVLPNEVIEDKSEGVRAANLVGTIGGMAAYYGPQRERQLRRAAGGMFGVDLRSEAETAREELQKLGRPQTDEEHQRYADVLDRVQAGAGLQYMMGIAQEKRDSQELDLKERKFELDQMQVRENIRINSMNLVREMEAGQKPKYFQTGGRVVAVTEDAEGNARTEVIYDDSEKGDDSNALKIRGLMTAAGNRYSDDTASFKVLAENILAGNITDAKDFEDYVVEEEPVVRGSILAGMQGEASENSQAGMVASQAADRVTDLFGDMDKNGLLDAEGNFNETFRSVGGFVGSTQNQIFDGLGMRDDISKYRTAATREINQQVVDNLPPGVASDRDIELFKKGFPPENAGMEEIVEYLQQARYVYEEAAEYAAMRESVWDKMIEAGEDASDRQTFTAWSKFKNARDNDFLGVALRMIDEQYPDDENRRALERNKAIETFNDKYGAVPYKYRFGQTR